MPNINKNVRVPYQSEQMFQLVDNFALYPEFLPWCTQATEIQRDNDWVIAKLSVSKGPFKQSFTTKNTLNPHTSIHMELMDGPFQSLNGAWHFTPIDAVHTSIDFAIEFEFANRIIGKMLEPIFLGISQSMVNLFTARAHDLYG